MCDHGHSHGGCCHDEAQQIPASEVFQYNLHQNIDKAKVTVLNESKEGAGVLVFKSSAERLDKINFVESDCDEELLFNIPFSSHVKIMGMSIFGEGGTADPAKIKLFKDRPAMSFDNCSIEADQEIDLKQDPSGVVDYPLKATKFNNVTHLTIQVVRNFGEETTRVYYIGLRGEYQHDFRQKVAIATYEARPLAEDHKGEIPGAIGRTLF